MKQKFDKKILTMNPRSFIWFCVLGLMALFFSSCANLQFQSKWKNEDIVIDGKSDDWVGHLIYAEKQKVSLGIQNDSEYLYACLITEDPSVISSILRQGMILWFDPDGAKNKILGIKYPVGRAGTQREDRVDLRPGTQTAPPNRRPGIQAVSSELEILQGRKVPILTTTDKLEGCEVSINRSAGLIVYEIKVPLETDSERPFAIGAQKGAKINVGIEVPKMALPMNRPAGSMGRGGMGGRGGGIGGRGGSMGGTGGRGGGPRGDIVGPRGNMQKNIKVWAAVQLASAK